MKNEIKKVIDGILKEEGLTSNFTVETPADISNGDYSANVAMVLSKDLGKNPSEIADDLIEKIKTKEKGESFKKIEKAGAGFINFYLSDKVIRENVLKPSFENDILKGQTILVEYTNPNLFKQFHIGHLMNNAIGESLSRIFESNGANVERICFPSDVGPNIAKAVWGMMQQVAFFPQDQDSLDDKIKFLNEAYVFGNLQFNEDPEAEKEIMEINKQLFENPSIDLQTYYIKGKKWSLEHFDEMYKILGTKFDKFYFESETAPVGKKIVEENKGKVFEESEGAIVYKGEKKGLHTRVFINSKNLPTYESKDLGLATLKAKDFDFNESIIITGNEQIQYFKVMLAALEDIYPEIAQKTRSLTHGLMKIDGKKTSSREGKSITASDLIKKTQDMVVEKIKDRDLDKKQKEDIKNKVSISAIKYSILKQSLGKDIDFNFDKATSFEGDSGPYLQYTYVRTKSILEKAGGGKNKAENKDWETTNLERLLFQYKDVLLSALKDLAPQLLVTYLTNLASEFNSFYASEKILDADDPNSEYKISITKAVGETLKEGLNVLGVDTPSKM